MAPLIASSLHSGDGGTFASQAMFTKILNPAGMVIGGFLGSSELGEGAGETGVYTAGCKVDDLMQKPATGLRDTGTVVFAMVVPSREVAGG